MLGTFRVERHGTDTTPTGQPAQALKIVAARGSVHVEELADELWGDAAEGSGRVRLRNVFLRLRDACGEVLTRRGDMVGLAAGAATDADTFLTTSGTAIEALRRDDPNGVALASAALALHEGPVLPSDPYAPWASRLRARIHHRAVALHDALAHWHATRGEVDAAIESWREAVLLEPHDEARYLRMAGALRDAGRHGAAMSVAREASDMLRRLDLPVAEELREFLPGT